MADAILEVFRGNQEAGGTKNESTNQRINFEQVQHVSSYDREPGELRQPSSPLSFFAIAILVPFQEAFHV